MSNAKSKVTSKVRPKSRVKSKVRPKSRVKSKVKSQIKSQAQVKSQIKSQIKSQGQVKSPIKSGLISRSLWQELYKSVASPVIASRIDQDVMIDCAFPLQDCIGVNSDEGRVLSPLLPESVRASLHKCANGAVDQPLSLYFNIASWLDELASS